MLKHVLISAGGAFVLIAGALAVVAGPVQAAPASPSLANPLQFQRSCAKPTKPGTMSCFALRRTDAGAHPNSGEAATVAVSGYTPTDLRSAYKLGTGGVGATVAIVDAYDDPTAEADLATYRANFALPACTTGNGCFNKVNQNGAASPLPATDAGWAGEISLDLDMVSAICPSCHILLVEASSATDTALFSSVNTAVSLGAKFVSNSWGGAEESTQTTLDAQYLNHPGVAITASSGDDGTGASYPATSQYVTAVGGTSLRTASTTSRGWTETAWSGAGSGCSAIEAKPTWQTVTTGCARRAEADVSAVADPATGVAVYQTFGASGWNVYGGTSVASPIIASVYALAGTPGASDHPVTYPYAHATNLFDVVGGSNGTCGAPMCTSVAGWDGPTGLGTPNGTAAFGTAVSTSVTVVNPGNQAGTVGTATSLTLQASGGTGAYTWSATGLPTGLSLNTTTGVVSGTPTVSGTFTVVANAVSGTLTGTATFTWTIAPAGSSCTAAQLLGNPGFETGSAAPWTATAGVINVSAGADAAHSGTHFAWLDGYGTTHTDTLSQTVTIPATCHSATLGFWLNISTAETTTTTQFDKLTVTANGTSVATFSNLNHGAYALRTVNLSAYIGKSVTITFTGVEDSSLQTSFELDDTSVQVS